MSTKKIRSVDQVIASMSHRFQAEASKNIKASYQWSISGENGREFCVQVNDGSFSVVDGRVEKPSVTFETDDVTYLRLVNNEIKGMTAILTRKLMVRGNIYLASKMDQIFK